MSNVANVMGTNVTCPTQWNVTTVVMNSRGVFFGEDVFRGHFMIFVVQFILFSLANRAIYFLLRPLWQPKFVCSVLAGALVGPNGLGQLYMDYNRVIFPKYEMTVMRTIGAIAIAYFNFIVAVKMNVTVILRKFKQSVWLGLMSVTLPFGFILLLLSKIEISRMKSDLTFHLLFTAGVVVSRFLVYAFDELNLLSSEISQLVMSSSITSELVTWVWLLVGICVRQRSINESLWALLGVVATMLFVIFVLRPLVMYIIAKTPEGRPVKEVFVIAILLCALVLMGIGDIIGAINLGVLVFGMVIPDGPPLGTAIVEKAKLFLMEYLMPIYYIVIGYNLNVFAINDQDLKPLLGIIVPAHIVKFVSAMVPVLWCTPHEKHAVLVGLMAGFKGPFDLFLLNRRLQKEELNKSVYVIMVIIDIMTTAVLSPLVEKMHEHCMRLEAQAHKNLRAIQTTPTDVEFRMLYCIQSEEDIPGVVSLLEAANASPLSPLCAYIIHLQELIGRAMPVFVSHNTHHRQVKLKSEFHISRAFENYLRSSDGRLTIKTFTVIAPRRNMHLDICRLAQTELIPVIIMPFHQNSLNDSTADASKAMSAYRNVNSNVQDHAPCTVGILVDKGMRRWMPISYTGFSCNVAVLFLGGADDREALALGARMSGHPGVNLFVLRLAFKRKETELEDVMDRKADDIVLSEFRCMAKHNDRVSYSEAAVDDMARIVSEVQALEDRFDLIIVGRQRESTRMMFDSRFEWSENLELGGIGEIIALPDFKGTNMSLLVLQHHGISRRASIHNVSSENDDDDNYLLDRSGRF